MPITDGMLAQWSKSGKDLPGRYASEVTAELLHLREVMRDGLSGFKKAPRRSKRSDKVNFPAVGTEYCLRPYGKGIVTEKGENFIKVIFTDGKTREITQLDYLKNQKAAAVEAGQA